MFEHSSPSYIPGGLSHETPTVSQNPPYPVLVAGFFLAAIRSNFKHGGAVKQFSNPHRAQQTYELSGTHF